MKTKIFFIAGLLISLNAYSQFAGQPMNLLAQWDGAAVDDSCGGGERYSDIWGYSANGREYAIIASANGTYFIDITNPTTPIVSDYVPGSSWGTCWRDYATYKNYCYMVTDSWGMGGTPTLQIVDLSYLPDSVHKVYDSSALFFTAHSVFVDCMKMYVCGGSTGNMAVYGLADPENPVLIKQLSDDYPAISYVHDMTVRHDTIYASCGFDGLHIYYFDFKFNELASITGYPFAGYNHSSWINADASILLTTDEVPNGLPSKLFDISDFGNITLLDTFTTNVGATPHNTFIMGNKAILSYYEDGVQVFDFTNPATAVGWRYYDTYPQNGTTYNGYNGCWGVFPLFKSGVIIASDRTNGLFVLDPNDSTWVTDFGGMLDSNCVDSNLSIGKETMRNLSAKIYPNPFSNELTVYFSDNSVPVKTNIEITDLLGRKVERSEIPSGARNLTIQCNNLPAGVYFLRIKGERLNQTFKIVKAE